MFWLSSTHELPTASIGTSPEDSRFWGGQNITPRMGGFRFVPGDGAIAARHVLFVGVVDLFDFRYREIREFSTKVLSSLAGEAPATRVLALTVRSTDQGTA